MERDPKNAGPNVLSYPSPVVRKPRNAGDIALAVVALMGAAVSGLLAAGMIAGWLLLPNVRQIGGDIGLPVATLVFAGIATLATKLGLALLRKPR